MNGDASTIRVGNAIAATSSHAATRRGTVSSGADNSTTGSKVIADIAQSETISTFASIAAKAGKIDQYFPIMAAAAAAPASAAHSALRVSNERTKNQVQSAHSGISTVLALYLSAWKLKKGMKVSSSSPATRFSPSRVRSETRHA